MPKPTPKQVKTSRVLDDLSGLTDLNMTQPSMTNSVQANPATDELFASMPDDVKKLVGPAISDFAKAEVLKKELQHLKEQPAESTKDNLLTVGSLVKLLGAGAAGALGGPAGLAAALGIGVGTVKKAQETAILDNDAHAQALKAKSEELDKAQELIGKNQDRMQRVFDTNPLAFGGLSPEAIGWLITGADIPLAPGALAAENSRKDRWDKQWTFLNEGLKGARTVEDAKNITNVMMHMLTDPGSKIPPGAGDAIARSLGTPEQDATILGQFLRWGGQTGLSAAIYAHENGLPYTDASVLKKIVFRDQDNLQPSQLLNQKVIDLVDEVNLWSKNNPEQYQRIVDKAKDQPDEFRQVAEAALSGRPGDVQFLFDKANVPPEFNMNEFLKMYGTISDQFSIVSTMAQGSAAKAMKGMTPKQVQDFKVNATVQFGKDLETNAKTNGARNNAVLRNQTRTEIQNSIPDLKFATANKIVDMMMEEALVNARRADGTVDERQLQVEMQRLLPEYIKDYNGETEE